MGTLAPDKEHPDSPRSLVAQRLSCVHQSGIATELTRELEEVALRLSFVAPSRLLVQAIEIYFVPPKP